MKNLAHTSRIRSLLFLGIISILGIVFYLVNSMNMEKNNNSGLQE